MSKTYREFVEEAKTKTITITKEQLAETAAEALTEEPFDALIKKDPMMILVLGLHAAKIARKLFDEEEDEEPTSETEGEKPAESEGE